jgi:Periplasmic protein TonB, links inner and outer membranes
LATASNAHDSVANTNHSRRIFRGWNNFQYIAVISQDMKIVFALLILLLPIAATVVAQEKPQQKTHTLSGTIKDPNGAVITGLAIFDNEQLVRTAVTNVNGDFKIDLLPGDHILTINSPDLYNFRAFVKITENGLNPDKVEFTVDPSRVCCSSLSGIPFPKPTLLPKPPFPPAARATRTMGEVVVTVLIDREGKVVSAVAENGHPLLKTIALVAARGSLFEPAEIAEREAKLNYIFYEGYEKKIDGLTR